MTQRKPGPPGVTLVAALPAAAYSPAVSAPSPSLSWWFIGAGVFVEAPPACVSPPVKEKGASAPYLLFFNCFG